MPGDVEGFEEVTIKAYNAKSILRYVLVGGNLPKLSWRERSPRGCDVTLLSDMDGWVGIISSGTQLCSLDVMCCFHNKPEHCSCVFVCQVFLDASLADCYWMDVLREKGVKLDIVLNATKLLLLSFFSASYDILKFI